MTATAEPLPCDDDAADPVRPPAAESPTAAVIRFRLTVAASFLNGKGGPSDVALACLLEAIAEAAAGATDDGTDAERIRWTPVLMRARAIADQVLPPVPELPTVPEVG